MAKQSLLLSMVKNQYDHLDDTSDKDDSTNSPVRKAHKKLREINKLKKKKNLTKEELEKIMQEDEWLAIVNSEYEVTSENPQDLLLRKDKQHQKQQQTLDRKLKAQEKQIKRLEQENQELKQTKQELKQEKQELNNVNIEKDNLINRLFGILPFLDFLGVYLNLAFFV